MNLTKSCYKTIVKQYLKQMWWAGALLTLLMYMFGTNQLIDYYSDTKVMYYSDIMEFGYAWSVFGAIFGLFIGVSLLSYLNKVNSISFFHSLPVKRSTILLSHITTASVLLTAPALLNFLVSVVTLNKTVPVKFVLFNVAMYLLYAFLLFSLTILVGMLTGSSVAGAIFTVVLVYLPIFLAFFVNSLCSEMLYGFAGDAGALNFVNRTLYVSPNELLSVKCIPYIVIIVVATLLTFFVYSRRDLENGGEVIAFPHLRGLFKVLFGICVGICGYYYDLGMRRFNAVAMLVVFTILGVVAANMISSKKITLKGVVKPLLVALCIVCATIAALMFDLTGFEKSVPESDEIESVEFTSLGYDNTRYVYGEGRTKEYFREVPRFDSKEEIELFRTLHKYKIQNRNVDERANLEIVTFEYTLKNGSKVMRRYSLDENERNTLLSPIYKTDTYKKMRYPILDDKDRVYTSLRITDKWAKDENSTVALYDGVSENAKTLIECIKKDRQNATYEWGTYKANIASINIEIEYKEPYFDENGNKVYFDDSEVYIVTSDDVNTWTYLENNGIFDNYEKLTCDDILYAYVYAYDSQSGQTLVEDSRITDSSDIEELMQFCTKYGFVGDNTDNGTCTVNVEFVFKENDSINYYVECKYSDLPKVIAE